MLYALLYSVIKEAVPIEPKQPRHISTDGVKSTAGATGQPVPKKKKPKRKRHPVAAFFRFIGCLLCVCVMAASVGGVLLSMYIVQVTANDGDVLDLDNQKNKQTTIVYDKNSDEYATLTKGENRIWRELSAMPENLQHAVIAIEDKDFYNEPGINIKRTIGAALNEFTDHALYGSQQGASTLEQQLIKNLTGDNEQDNMRKVREIFRALGLSNKYSKETVLEAYLNTIPLTGIVCGMEAGANEYFGKHVEDLTLSECAILASITKNPTKYNPFTNPEQLMKRRNHVLYEMYNQGYITEDEYNSATAETIKVVESKGGAENVTRTSNNSYFTDALFNEVVQDIMTKEGISESEAQKLLYTGGFTIEATVNTKLQSQMENLMLNTDDAYFPAGWHEEEVTSISDDDVQVFNEDGTPKTRTGEDGTVYYYRNVRTQAAMVTLDYDGNVLAIAGGLGEKTKSLSLNRAYNVERQTGSTIKPIGAYALGIEYGLVNWSTMLNNSPLYQKQDMIIRDEDYCRKNGLMGLSDKQLRAYPNAWRSWPRNYGGNYGDGSDLPLWNGLARSLNTIAVRVGDLVGASNIFNFVYNTLQLNTLDPTNDVGLAQMVMGSQTKGVTPMALAAAFQIFYDGEYTTPHLYTRVLDREGNIYLENNATSYQALTPDTAYVMNRLLKNVLFSSVGTASGRYPNSNGMEAFGKTGTASDEKDLWFVGGTPYYVTAVWWGYDAPYDMTKTLSKQQAKTRTCVTAWKALMEQAQADLPYKAFPASAGVVERRYCTQSGLLAGAGCPSTAVGYYRADDLPDTCTYSHAAPQAAAPAENTDDAVPTQPVTPTDTSALDTE